MIDQPLDRLLAAFTGRLAASSVCVIQDGWRLSFPAFDSVAIHFVLKGSGRVRVGEGAWHSFRPRSVILVPPHRPHLLGDSEAGERESAGGDHCAPFGDGLVAFTAGDGRADALMVCAFIPRQEGHALGLVDLFGGCPVEDLAPEGLHAHAFDLMRAEVERPSLGLRAMTEALMRQCLVLLVRRRLLDEPGLPMLAVPGHPRLADSILAVLESPGAPHSVGSLAALAGMGRTAFAEGFSRAFGQAPIEFVQKARLHAAARLLSTTDLPVKVIATSVGYASRSHFSRSFAAAYGRDPSRFREGRATALEGA